MMSPDAHERAPLEYDVAIVGGGASGTALLYVLARYTDVPRIALIEKYPALGTVNSNARNNSQTLHVGDIETNYSIEKAKEVQPASMMVKRYTETLGEEARTAVIRKVQKMALAVGNEEVALLRERYPKLKALFPALEWLDGAGIAEREGAVMRGRRTDEPVGALFNPEGYAVNYGRLAESLAADAARIGGARVSVHTGTEVAAITRDNGRYLLTAKTGVRISARIVVVDADAYSLGFAKKMGLGTEFSLIPIAGNFYFTDALLTGKVYTVQKPRMPFAALHGDPDLTEEGSTRFGPTARFYPVLEARNLKTAAAFFKAAGLHRPESWISFISILLEPIRFWYLIQNFFYDLPFVGRYALAPSLRKIIPSLRARDLRRAKGYGGMRLQRVNTKTRELLLGEGKIVGENIIFNMTPSPGASVCLYNATRDAEQIVAFDPSFSLNKALLVEELCSPDEPLSGDDVSLERSYAS